MGVSLWIGLGASVMAFAAACAPGSDDLPDSTAGATSGGATEGSGSGGAGAAGAGTGGELLSGVGGSSTATSTGSGGGAGAPCSFEGGMGGPEMCGNGIDDDNNGFIDETCSCVIGETQTCYLGAGTLCECKSGQQACVATGEFGQWGPCNEGAAQGCNAPLDPTCEICGNGTDDDCDGQIDEGCVIDTMVNIDGDCVTAQCPPQAPYPIACNIVMAGNDPRGCVASMPSSSVVYFQEGDKCGAGNVSGTLTCSSQQGVGLNAMNCVINKSQKYYPADPSGCPAT